MTDSVKSPNESQRMEEMMLESNVVHASNSLDVPDEQKKITDSALASPGSIQDVLRRASIIVNVDGIKRASTMMFQFDSYKD